MTKRDKIVEELIDITHELTEKDANMIATYIISRERKLQEELESLKEKAWKYDELCK